MIKIFKTSKKVIVNIDEYFDNVEMGILNFKEGVNNYLDRNTSEFETNLSKILKLEENADDIIRKIENDFYVHSLMPNYSSDILNLLEKVDDIIDQAKETLSQFEVENPYFPEDLKSDISRLISLSVSAAENVIPAARIYFTAPTLVKDKIQKVIFYERETNKLGTKIKRRLFKEMDYLKLSEKIHLRYFTLHIEMVSDASKVVAKMLSSLVIKIRM
jgi:predicted phosphate transport protein (TIGR00153 family)